MCLLYKYFSGFAIGSANDIQTALYAGATLATYAIDGLRLGAVGLGNSDAVSNVDTLGKGGFNDGPMI